MEQTLIQYNMYLSYTVAVSDNYICLIICVLARMCITLVKSHIPIHEHTCVFISITFKNTLTGHVTRKLKKTQRIYLA